MVNEGAKRLECQFGLFTLILNPYDFFDTFWHFKGFLAHRAGVIGGLFYSFPSLFRGNMPPFSTVARRVEPGLFSTLPGHRSGLRVST